VKGRWLVIVVALIACVAFAMSVQGGSWWTFGDTEVGPFRSSRCFDGNCQPTNLNWLGAGDRWMRIGMGTWAGGLIAAFVLVVMSASLAAKRIPKLAAKTALVAIATAGITGGLFAAQFPRGEFPAAELGRGALLFIAAIACGIIASILVLRGKPLTP
jgi:hypothetical protein